MSIKIIDFKRIEIEWLGVLNGQEFQFQAIIFRNPSDRLMVQDNCFGVFGPFDTLAQALEDVKSIFHASRQ